MLGCMSNLEITSPLRGIPRRELLSWIWLIAATAAAAKATELTYSFVRTSRAAQRHTRFDAGTVADLGAMGDAPQPFPEGRFWVAQTPEGVAALDGVCTHLDCLLGWDEQVHEFICPCHGSHYDTSGRIRKGPAPKNLAIPPYEFIDDTTIRIG